MSRIPSSAVNALNILFEEIETRGATVGTVGLVIFLISPFVLNNFYISIGISLLFGAATALSWNLLAMTGYINFGHVMFIGLGAFTAGHVTLRTGIGTRVGLGVIGIIILSGVICSGFALIISYPLLRLSGYYFALAAFGISQALLALFNNSNLLRGSDGIIMPSLQTSFVTLGPSGVVYYLMLSVAIISIIVTYMVRYSSFGYRLQAIRLAEDTADMLGIPTTRYTTVAFAISGFLAGMAGSVYAYYLSYLTAQNVFNVVLTIDAIVMTMIGGLGTVLGPIIGAVVFILFTELILDSVTTQGQLLFTGVIIIFIVTIAPGGLLKYVNRFRETDTTDVYTNVDRDSD